MAFTVSHMVDGGDVHGKSRVKFLRVLSDGTEANIASGLDVIYGLAVAYASAASAPMLVKENRNSSGTADNGTIGISGVASGDELLITVWGR